MIKLETNFHSVVLETKVNIIVLLPEAFSSWPPSGELDTIYKKNRNYKSLYLLHGAYDDASCWLRHTSVELFADEKKLAVILPSVDNTFYADTFYGKKYFTFITEELPRFITTTFPVSDKPEDTNIAGLSMGGYGALKSAFTYPSRYHSVGSFSGAVDIHKFITNYNDNFHFSFNHIFENPEKIDNTKNSLFYLIDELKHAVTLPKIFQCCGTEDFLYEDNLKLKEYLSTNHILAHFHDGPGDHQWNYWNQSLKEYIQWI